jgi:chromosome segregation ATPase
VARRDGSGPRDLTVQILTQIRDEIRGLRGAQNQTNEEVRGLRDEVRDLRAAQGETNERLGVVETTLRDLAEQMLVLGRAIKVAIEHRKAVDQQLHDHERRLGKIEKRIG